MKKIVKTYKRAFIDLSVKGFFIRTTPDSSWEDPYFEFYTTDAPNQIGITTKTTFSSSWNKTRIDSIRRMHSNKFWLKVEISNSVMILTQY